MGTRKRGISPSRRIVSAFGTCASGRETARVAISERIVLAVRLPGFVNAHSHPVQRAPRGPTEGGRFWAWRELMLEESARQTPELVRESYARVYREMRRAGFTAVGEFHYLG